MLSPLLVALALAAASPRCAEVIGISDLHGRLDALPEIAARVAELRARGPVVVLDAGDSIQGTLEAYATRGRAVVVGLGRLGIDGAAMGNHDLDYGAAELRKRAAEAPYPLLAANVRAAAGGRLPWRNLRDTRLVRLEDGPVVGIVGLAGRDTPWTTSARNVVGLRFSDPARAAARAARALRRAGAEVVVVVAHVGGDCRAPRSDGTCQAEGALVDLARRLPGGLVDAIVGGHTHQILADVVGGVAVVQAGARGRALARARVCAGAAASAEPPLLMDAQVETTPDGSRARADMRAALDPFLEAARAEHERSLGVTLQAPLERSRDAQSPFGAAAAQSLRHAARSDFGLVNQGSLRVDLPAGPLVYGQLYEALPFDDRLVVVTATGAEIAGLVRALERAGKGRAQLAGLVGDGGAWHTCSGAPLEARRRYTVAMNEFLAGGGDGAALVTRGIPRSRIAVREGAWLRDLFLAWLREAPAGRVAEPCP